VRRNRDGPPAHVRVRNTDTLRHPSSYPSPYTTPQESRRSRSGVEEARAEALQEVRRVEEVERRRRLLREQAEIEISHSRGE
jgi:hypothetical protein